MKKKNNKIKILIILLLLLVTTGCTQTLMDKDNKPVKNEITGQTLTKNIICQPTNKTTIELYEKNNVKIEKLPKCKDFKVTSGKYEGLWTSVFVKSIAYFLIKVGFIIGNFAISVIIASLIIRLIAFPVTKKTAMQSELMKKAQPELEKIQKKYKGKDDQESMMKQNQEMMQVYQKYKINPIGGCIFALLQLPLFIAFFEAIQRTPVIFEGKFLGLQLGTTPMVGITSVTFYSYLVLMIIIAATTFYSFKMTAAGNMSNDPTMKMMPIMMSVMIVITAIFMPAGLGIYWVTSNIFTIVQYIIMKRSKEANGKA